MDSRLKQLAENLVSYSIKLEKGENVLITALEIHRSLLLKPL